MSNLERGEHSSQSYDDANKVQLRQVQLVKSQQVTSQSEYILQEVPVALVYNGISHVVMMVTGADLVEFAIGFSLSEGIIPNREALYGIEVLQHATGFTVEMEISSRAFLQLKQQRRNLAGRSGCGLCGVESLQQFQQDIPQVTTTFQRTWLNEIQPAIVQLRQYQPLGQLSGASHAAAWVVQGQIVKCFEDIGRHNALDKLLGYLAQQHLSVADGFVLMSSRASYELIRKCAQFNIAMLATISAPSSLAIDLAQRAGLTLLSFCREQRFTIYAQGSSEHA